MGEPQAGGSSSRPASPRSIKGGAGGRRRRHPRLPADQPDRPQPRRGRRRPTSIRSSRRSSPRPTSARRTSSSPAASCWSRSAPSCARRTWTTLEEGQVREGVVRSVKDFGAFVDIGGVDGLLPIGEMSWSRVNKADDLVRIGDKVTVKVLKIDQTAQAHPGPQAAHAQPLGRSRPRNTPAGRWSRERSRG